MKKIQILDSTEAEFPKMEMLLPSDLISLSKEYSLSIPKLMDYVKNTHVEILFVRMKEDGQIFTKTVKGAVSSVDFKKNSFDFCFKQTEDDETGTIVHVRTDNVLGYVPLVPGSGIMPYQCSQTKEGVEYFKHLKKMRKIAKSCVGVMHTAILTYKHQNGETETIYAQILKVNKSNLEIIQKKSERGTGIKKSITLGNIPKVELNVSTEKYLCGIKINFNIENNISPFDDGEIF